MNTYERVFPRDLFNEAKLLKCIGQVMLLAHNYNAPIKFKLVSDLGYNGFVIEQYESDGSLYVANHDFTVNGDTYHIYTPYNSKDNYPLKITAGDEDFDVLDMAGNFSEDFRRTFGV